MIELSGFPGLYSSPKSSRIVSQILSNKNAYFFLHIEKFQNRPGQADEKEIIERIEPEYIRRKYRLNSANRLLYNIYKVSSVFCGSYAFFW